MAPQANKSTDYKFSLVRAVVSLRADAAPYNKNHKQYETSKTSLPPDCRPRIRLLPSNGTADGDRRGTARERYELLLQRCPGIVEHLALQDLASFLCITPNYLSTIRKSITFEVQK